MTQSLFRHFGQSVKVAFLSEFESRHGGENSLLAILPHLINQGVRPIFIAPSQGDFADAVRDLNIEIIDFRRVNPDGFVVTQAESREKLAEILRRLSPDLVHANSLAMGRLAGPVVRELNLPGISHLRDIVRLNRQAVADLNANSRLIAVSHATKNYHLAQGITPEKCHVVYNGVDLTTFRFRRPTDYLHRELGLPNEAILLGNIGQIGLRKGHLPLFAAMQQVVEMLPQTHLVIVGKRWSSKAESMEYEQTLRDLAAQPPLKGHVHFLGVRHDVPTMMNELTLLLHTARQEPLGRVLLEAAASQLPVIATNVGGTSEIFSTPNSALLLDDPKNQSDADFAATIAQSIFALLADDQRRNQIAQNARQIAEQHFSHEQSAGYLLQQYAEVLG